MNNGHLDLWFSSSINPFHESTSFIIPQNTVDYAADDSHDVVALGKFWIRGDIMRQCFDAVIGDFHSVFIHVLNNGSKIEIPI